MPLTVVSSLLVSGAGAGAGGGAGVAALARAASVRATAETRIRCCAFMRLFLFIGRFFTGGTYCARSEGVCVIPPGLRCVGWVMTQRCALHLFSVSRNLQFSFLLKEGGQPLPAVLLRNVVRGRGVPTGLSQAPPMPVHTPL